MLPPIIFSPTGRPYTYGGFNSTINRQFPSSICIVISTSVMNFHHSTSNVSDVISGGSSGWKSSSPPKKNVLNQWVKDIDVEGYQHLNQLLMLKEQLEGTRENIFFEDSDSFQALFA
ncbi:hypothetical protein H5410_036838 [Solanum commersonii]|uniref:Uncharacterized protein n=1 Tax=Solanum commersonii TaxID=4109 RepID=A0A9J5Y9D7_SOLCO|nr:hypothetical protein H5410_036838 [Solanum commersonii]